MNIFSFSNSHFDISHSTGELLRSNKQKRQKLYTFNCSQENTLFSPRFSLIFGFSSDFWFFHFVFLKKWPAAKIRESKLLRGSIYLYLTSRGAQNYDMLALLLLSKKKKKKSNDPKLERKQILSDPYTFSLTVQFV